MIRKEKKYSVQQEKHLARDVASVDQIREFFSENTDLFSDPDQIMPAILDGRLCLDMIASVAATQQPEIQNVLDLGCGGGNASNLLLQKLRSNQSQLRHHKPDVNLTLVDLSRDMLKNAKQTLSKQTTGSIKTLSQDLRTLDLQDNHYDVVLCSLVLHHLRDTQEWIGIFKKLHNALAIGGSLYIFDLIDIPNIPAHQDAYTRYGHYLAQVVDEPYRDFVFDHIDQEDTPRPLLWQIDQLHAVGFQHADILHKHLCYAAFYAIK